jgi:hypothetical protein
LGNTQGSRNYVIEAMKKFVPKKIAISVDNGKILDRGADIAS